MQSVHLQLPADLLARVDEAAGDVPRNRWIRRAIEGALDERLAGFVAGPLSPTSTRVQRWASMERVSAPARSTAQVKRGVQPRPKGGKK